MPRFYLTPASISYLTQSIMALVITGYFVYRAIRGRRTGNWKRTALLVGFFAAITLFSLLLFLETSLQRGEDFYALFPQNVVMGVALVFLLQFAYHFPTLYPRRKWESYLVLGLSLCYTLWELQLAVQRFQLLGIGQTVWRPANPDRALAAGLLLVPVVLLRQAITASDPEGRSGLKRLRYLWRPQGREGKAARDLALVYFIPFVLSLVNIFTANYFIPRAGYHLGLSVGILVALTAFAVVYLDHLPETTSFIVKVVAVSLMVILTVLGMAGWVTALPLASNYHPTLPNHVTLRFSPNAHGGYDVTSQPFYFEHETGITLNRNENWMANAVDFSFPFYGQTYQQVYVSNDGAIIMGQNVPYSYLHYRYGGSAPAIFPLLVDFSPEASPAGVLVRQDADRLIVTWDRVPAFYQPEAVCTFQVILYSDGTFDFSYQDIPDNWVYLPNNEPGATPWVIGATPGDLSQRVQEVDLSRLPISGDGRGIVQDYQLAFRRYLHQGIAPLAYLVIGSSFFVLAGISLLLYTGLIRPLNALLHGVQQMNARHYDVRVEVQHPDEIGFLTQSFNAMAAELGTLISDLEKKVEERLAEIRQINRELTVSKEQIDILHAIDQAILGAQSPQTIAWSVLGRLPQLIPCRRVSVVEFSSGAATLLASEADGVYDMNLNNWLAALFHIAHDQPRIQGAADIREIPNRSPFQTILLEQELYSYIIIPLLTQEQIVGALVIESDQPDNFTSEHVEIAAQVGAMLAIAIHQAQLRRSLEKRTQELQAQNAELDAFAHTVAHDLKNPISAVASSTQLLIYYGHAMSKDELLQIAQVASNGALNAARIVDNLLLLAQTQKLTGEQQHIDMAATVKNALGSLENMIREYQAEIIAPATWPQALGYGPWIEEVWVNYISNAIKYGGRPPRIELGATEQPDNTVRFWVRDNGNGLTPAEQACLFTPFERLGQARIQGHGLGLSIVRRIVEKLGGQVGVESTPGQGSTFYFTLPAAPRGGQD